MNIAVLGTGMVGQALAARLDELGHAVTVGTRDPAASLARTDDGGLGSWHRDHPDVAVAPFSDAASAAELIVLAALGSAALDILDLAGADNLRGKVVVDISNPLDLSHGMPPTLFVNNTDSLGEQVQRTFPEARVVKTLNTMNAYLMADPARLAEGDFSTFVSGDDAQAKATVVSLLESMGHRDVIDLGDITSARGVEMMMPIWLRLWSSLGTPMFTFKIVR